MHLPFRSFPILLWTCMATLLVLSSCYSPHHEGKPLPLLTFSHLKPIPIAVGSVRTHTEASFVTESFVVSPYKALENYLHARFVPAGPYDGQFEGMIQEASLRHSYEPSPANFQKFLNVGGFDVYDMNIRVKLSYLDRNGALIRGSTLSVQRIVKVSEHASIAERERRQFEAMENLFVDLDTAMQKAVLDDMNLRF